jgi:hypothetical protein
MSSPKVVIGLNATSIISQIQNNATSIGSSAGSVICQLPNNATSIGANSLSSNTQMSFIGELVGQGPVGVTNSSVTGPTGPTGPSPPIEEATVVLEERIANNRCCFKWR